MNLRNLLLMGALLASPAYGLRSIPEAFPK